MKSIIAVTLAVLWAGCVGHVKPQGIYCERKLDLRYLNATIERFLGRNFEGNGVAERVKDQERYFEGWDEERLWKYLVECREERGICSYLERKDEAIWVGFHFVGRSGDKYDTYGRLMEFRLKNKQVDRVNTAETSSAGLAWWELSDESRRLVRMGQAKGVR